MNTVYNNPDLGSIRDTLRVVVRSLGAVQNAIQSGVSVVINKDHDLQTDSLESFFLKRGSAKSLADTVAHVGIIEMMKELYPSVFLVSEEDNSNKVDVLTEWVLFFDPLNGSLHYLQGGKEYEINLLLCRAGKPVLGLSYQPSQKLEYLAASDIHPIKVEKGEKKPLVLATCTSQVVLYNRRIKSKLLDQLQNAGYSVQPSVNDNVACLQILDGTVCAFLAITPYTWDVGVSGYILSMLGGFVANFDLQPLIYTTRRIPTFLASHDRKTAEKIASLINSLDNRKHDTTKEKPLFGEVYLQDI